MAMPGRKDRDITDTSIYRWLTLILSACGLGLAIYQFYEEPLELWTGQNAFNDLPFVTPLLILIIIAVSYISRQEIKRLTSAIGDVKKALDSFSVQVAAFGHKVNHTIRDGTTKLLYLKGSEKNFNMENLQSEAKHVGTTVCNHTSSLLGVYVGKKVSVSIKILKTVDGTLKAITLARDENCGSERAIGDEHPIDARNTAFHLIKTGEVPYFFEPNLIRAETEKRYSNTNPRWRNQYRSAIVVPIQRESLDQNTEDKHVLRGYFCADARDEETFASEYEDLLVNVMLVAADALYVYLDNVRTIRQMLEENH
jgi:hypothetical protein